MIHNNKFEPLLKELRLLNVYDMHDLKVLKFMYKLYHDELPIYLDNYIVIEEITFCN